VQRESGAEGAGCTSNVASAKVRLHSSKSWMVAAVQVIGFSHSSHFQGQVGLAVLDVELHLARIACKSKSLPTQVTSFATLGEGKSEMAFTFSGSGLMTFESM